MDSPGGSAALRADARPVPGRRRCWSPTWSTSATSPASPGRPALLLVLAGDARASSPTAATASRRPTQLRRRRASTPSIEIDRRPASARSLPRPRRGWPRSASRPSTSPGPRSGRYADELVRRRRAGAPPTAWSRSSAHGQGRRRDRPDRGGRAHRRRGAGRGAAPPARRAHRGRVRPRARHRRCGASAPTGRRFETIVAGGPNGGPAPRPPVGPRDRRRATWW